MKHSFFKGAIVLTSGILISRLIGIFFVFPFSRLVGPLGLSLFSYAYIPYTIFIDISTLGIPLGLSKLVSKYNSNKEYNKSRKVFFLSLIFLSIIGIISFLLMNFFSNTYAKMVLGGDNLENSIDDVSYVIRMVSYSILIIPAISVFRGYLQGHQKMAPTAISQIVEQVIRVIIILMVSYKIMVLGDGDYVSAIGYSVLGSFFGAIGAFIILLIFFFRLPKRRSEEEFNILEVSKEMISYAIPFAFFGLSFPLFQLVDSLFFNRALLEYGISNPEVYYGVYSFQVQKLIFIPVAFAIGLSGSIMPSITESVEHQKYQEVHEKIFKGLNYVFIFLIPISFFTMLFSKNIYALFYSNKEIGARILFEYSSIILLFGLNNALVGIMQGSKVGKYLYFSIPSGVLIKLALSYMLIRKFGVFGAILSSFLGMLFMVVFNTYMLHKKNLMEFSMIARKIALYFSIALGLVLIIYPFYKHFPYDGDSIFLNVIYLSSYGLIFFLSYFLIINLFKNKAYKSQKEELLIK